MSKLNLRAKNGGTVRLGTPDNVEPDTEVLLPGKSGTLATKDDLAEVMTALEKAIKRIDTLTNKEKE